METEIMITIELQNRQCYEIMIQIENIKNTETFNVNLQTVNLSGNTL